MAAHVGRHFVCLDDGSLRILEGSWVRKAWVRTRISGGNPETTGFGEKLISLAKRTKNRLEKIRGK